MEIELKIGDDQFVLLSPFKGTESPESNSNEYQLLDKEKKCWMKLHRNESSFTCIEKDISITDSDDDIQTKLDTLIVNVIEAEQSGTEGSEMPTADEENPFNPEDIKVHAKQFSLRLVTDMIESKDINLSPDFQRNFVWDNFQKSRLIESILLRIPLPMFYFSEDNQGKLTIVDGLQRLTTIKEFIDNQFPLRNLEYLDKSCEKKYFKNEGTNKYGIAPKYNRWFNQTQISVNVIDPSSPSKVKYDIFRRINTGGKPLNNQEIRNCLAGQGLRNILGKMTELEEFKEATNYGIKSTRMAHHEVSLRFILFCKLLEQDSNIETYNGYMDSSLDKLTDELYKIPEDDLSVYVDRFSHSMKNAKYLLGSSYAFRKVRPQDLEPSARKRLINKALFVSLSVLLSQFDHDRIRANNSENQLLQPLAEKINSDGKFLDFLSYGTNGKNNLSYTFNKIQELIDQNIKY